jgi:predicted MFS family arabinose efflux permease
MNESLRLMFSSGQVTPPKQRARAMSLFLLGPQCGPVLGPVLGGALAGESSWRWIFGFLAISAAVVWLLIVLSLPETLRCRVGNGDVYARRGFVIWPAWPSSDLAPESQRGPPPPKPTLIGYWGLFRYPPIGICSFNSAILYSSYFCIAVELPRALGDVYYWSPAAVGGGYLAVGVAMIVGSMVGGHFSDWRRTRAVKALGRDVDPEHRLIDQIWGVLLCAGGCLMFGWCVEESVHAAAVIVATFLSRPFSPLCAVGDDMTDASMQRVLACLGSS